MESRQLCAGVASASVSVQCSSRAALSQPSLCAVMAHSRYSCVRLLPPLRVGAGTAKSGPAGASMDCHHPLVHTCTSTHSLAHTSRHLSPSPRTARPLPSHKVHPPASVPSHHADTRVVPRDVPATRIISTLTCTSPLCLPMCTCG